ncbi:hypothetical protein T484DRAFT_2225860, partial [Baffinella frigidus]
MKRRVGARCASQLLKMALFVALSSRPAASGGQGERLLLRPWHHHPGRRTLGAPCGRRQSAVLCGLRGGVAKDEVADRLAALVSGLSAASRDNATDAALVEVNRAARERERVMQAIRDTLASLEVMGAPEHKPGYFVEQFVSLLDAEGFPRTDIPVMQIQVP